MEFRQHITQSAKEINLTDAEFKEVDKLEYKDIQKRIRKRFTNIDNEKDYLWLWENFNEEYVGISFRNDDAFQYLDKLIDENEKVWFIASEPDYKHWVYESSVKAIQMLIGNSYSFEYYIVSKKYEWLICENHHGLLMGIGEKAKERIKTLADDFADELTFTTEKQNKNTGI